MAITITMLGTSNTGKTCYLFGTADQMVSGRNGFNFVCTDLDDAYDLQEGWERILEGQWPLGSNDHRDYEFNVLLNGRKIEVFKWQDYRGHILDRDDPTDFQAFMSRCRVSDALLVCIPSEVLRDGISNDPSKQRNASKIYRRYTNLLMQVLSEKNVPVALVITKGDQIKTKDELKRGISDLQARFSGVLFDRGLNRCAMITRVFIGKFREDEMAQGTRFSEALIAPKNIHIPILFPIYWALSSQLAACESDIASLRRDKNQFIQNANQARNQSFLSKLWNGDDSAYYDSQAKDTEQRIQEVIQTIDDLKRSLAAIWKEFEATSVIFDNGKQICGSGGYARKGKKS